MSTAANEIHNADAVYDVSAGDSFTDLYGERRFRTVVLPKLIALESGRPLVLLPQTYGPFQSPKARVAAARIVRQAHMAWARDADSFAALKNLLGMDFDPARHRSGVDMAFALPAFAPDDLSPELRLWLQPEEREQHELIGLNVSGLIYNEPRLAAEQFGLKADYQQLVHRFLDWIMQKTTARVVLVPHVTAPRGHAESDYDAARKVFESLDESGRSRVTIAAPDCSPSELKWLIGQTAWFCGTRMHSTIAALGSGVPTAAVSYSLKTRGVFETCGQAHRVFELRHQDADTIVSSLQTSFQQRAADRVKLLSRIPEVIRLAKMQLDDILGSVASLPSRTQES